MFKKMVVVLLLASLGSLAAMGAFESSNGWGLPGSTMNPTVIYASVDDVTSSFQFMVCFDPAVLQVDTIVPFGTDGIQTVFDTAWGGIGPQYFVTYWDNDAGFLQVAILYDLAMQNQLGPMDRTAVAVIYWTVKDDATIPSVPLLQPSEDCGGLTFAAVFGDTLGNEIPAETLISGDFYVLLPGDANGDGVVSYTDLVYLEQYIYSSGPVPTVVADVNQDCYVTYVDMVYLALYLFSGGQDPFPPACPWIKWPPSTIKGYKIGEPIDLKKAESIPEPVGRGVKTY